MQYCKLGDNHSIVSYRFGGIENKVVKIKNAPIDVAVTQALGINYNSLSRDYSFNFNGEVLTTYSFVCNAPLNIPSDAVCYITSGTWDDYGTVGNYSSPTISNQVNSFSGSPVPIGTGLQFNGSVTNAIRPACSAVISLQWRWGGWKIEISHDSKIVHSDSGQVEPTFNVNCAEDCPPGTTKCFSTNYPGYCCLSCSEIAGEIKAIASQIRRLK